jgi:heterodisulfide reductase subunit B
MNYLYFPGCSLESTGRAYGESMLAVFKALNVPVSELEDWNCCGATSYMAINELKAFALSARNFALAAKQNTGDGPANMLVPCAACYLGLNKTNRYLSEHPELAEKVDGALKAAGLTFDNKTKVRHPLDVLCNDIGIDKVKAQVKRPLAGMKVACYYGCQLVRPYADFDDQHNPTTMNRLMEALGAETVDWPLKTRCCGGSLTGTIQDVGLRLSFILLREARKRGANVIATACPLCQFNLECYQSKIGSMYDESVDIPVAYFTQLMGMGFGLEQREVGLQRLFVPLKHQFRTSAVEGGVHVSK